jgi:hypothetical protein
MEDITSSMTTFTIQTRMQLRFQMDLAINQIELERKTEIRSCNCSE